VTSLVISPLWSSGALTRHCLRFSAFADPKRRRIDSMLVARLARPFSPSHSAPEQNSASDPSLPGPIATQQTTRSRFGSRGSGVQISPSRLFERVLESPVTVGSPSGNHTQPYM
jgi:hypothetical protein